MWSDLSQDEKYELMKDYVRRGFNNLDDIMDDFDNQEVDTYEKSDVPRSFIHNDDVRRFTKIAREWYGVNGIDTGQ